MATAAATLPGVKRRPRNEPATGRASYPEIYFVKHIDNSRLRREVDSAKRRECFSLLGLSSVVFIFVMVFAWQHFECVRYGYWIQQLKGKQAAVLEVNHALKLECASLSDPERIDSLARTDLGLVAPQPGQIIQVGNTRGIAPDASDVEFAGNLREPIKIPSER